MQIAPELGIPEIKPAIESIGGRWMQKVSPQSRHSVLQARLGALLGTWAGRRGQVGTERRCYFLPQGERWSSLVPDVAYFSYERLPRDLGGCAKSRRLPRTSPLRSCRPTTAVRSSTRRCISTCVAVRS